MAKINSHFSRLNSPYIFPIIEEKLAVLQSQVASSSILNLGIGDIALPLAPSVVKAICQATQEMGIQESQKGYGPSEGYAFLRENIAKTCYHDLGISAEEIFISDGTNSDTANFQELFAHDSVVAIPDPTYPVYKATNIMAGRADTIIYLPCTEENDYLPQPPSCRVDLVYICSPNNPTGVALNRKAWEKWIAYAKEHEAVIVHDHAYSAFIRSPDVPSTVYEIPGAKEVVVECCSFSKTAGFTGLRCAWAVVPKALPHHLHALWKKRVTTKSNGVAYPIQKGALAALTPEGKEETKKQVDTYMEQALLLSSGLKKLGFSCFGGLDAPYIWWKTPPGMHSWQFFDTLLENCHLIAIPGLGFGQYGEGYVRLSTFTTAEIATKALERISQL